MCSRPGFYLIRSRWNTSSSVGTRVSEPTRPCQVSWHSLLAGPQGRASGVLPTSTVKCGVGMILAWKQVLSSHLGRAGRPTQSAEHVKVTSWLHLLCASQKEASLEKLRALVIYEEKVLRRQFDTLSVQQNSRSRFSPGLWAPQLRVLSQADSTRPEFPPVE